MTHHYKLPQNMVIFYRFPSLELQCWDTIIRLKIDFCNNKTHSVHLMRLFIDKSITTCSCCNECYVRGGAVCIMCSQSICDFCMNRTPYITPYICIKCTDPKPEWQKKRQKLCYGKDS